MRFEGRDAEDDERQTHPHPPLKEGGLQPHLSPLHAEVVCATTTTMYMIAGVVGVWGVFLGLLLSPYSYTPLALGATLLVVVCTYGVLYGTLAMACNPGLDSPSTLWDTFSRPPPSQVPHSKPTVLPPMVDLPITMANDAMFLSQGALERVENTVVDPLKLPQ